MEIDVSIFQKEFITATELYIGFVGGRSSGKTKAGAYRLLIQSILKPGPYGMYAPTFPMLVDNPINTFRQVAEPFISTYNKSSHDFVMRNGSTILCRSLDDPEHARGPNLRGAWVDEASLVVEDAFNILIACLRHEGIQGWLSATFTPCGKAHWTYKVLGPENKDNKLIHCSSKDNPFNPPGFVDRLRERYTSAFAQQEIDGMFVDLSGSMFHRAWFQIVDDYPHDVPCIRYWDMAASIVKNGSDPDWTAGGKVCCKDGIWYVIDMRHVQQTPMHTEQPYHGRRRAIP